MDDLPLTAATASVWIYWFIVGAMSWRVRRRTRRLAGVVPEDKVEQAMWLVWVPMVVLWMALPMIAGHSRAPHLSVPAFAREGVYANLRGLAGGLAVVALVLTIECWKRMGRSWRMAVTPGERTELITTGLYRSIRHPIYALSILLVVACALVLPTAPMIAVALVNVTLLHLKARHEERHLLAAHGEVYAAYLRTTGRFLPRLFASR
ncbi:MAG TPA: isoprenylcysteine carboxylmethyltransferase family protein [Casimicrobiaceae bacterium]|nr:isoprenylcysteine carboxylmethyltransferase family protein [Casimicrobiaceae bacterium]